MHSCASAKVLCWPWCLASQCTPLRAVYQCAEGTTKANIPSVLALGMVFTYSIPFFMVMLLLICKTMPVPSSESECSPMHLLSNVSLFWRETSFLVCIHFQQVALHIFTLHLCPVGHMHEVLTWGHRLIILHSGDHVPFTKVDSWGPISPFSCAGHCLLPGVIVQYPCHVW